MYFSKLRLSGFKSFVDPTELVIEAGLTGIVGPNGCGKSNLVEALRWVMGETSAKRLRGGEMDDVIFAGTSSRPARNVAEVMLHLDNARHDAPQPYGEFEEIQIARRIERGVGSDFRINGREARARDVQLLFADVATGAHSSGMISQGRVGAIITARPADRRGLLEEAAGISGLH
ncbi:MAG TPA: AAA family ATPase, partial [Stellaceae bacterium]|nr:AAA family ATPase [Stellaceae bacterium]